VLGLFCRDFDGVGVFTDCRPVGKADTGSDTKCAVVMRGPEGNEFCVEPGPVGR
jgi:hypothetical protein